MLLPAIMTVLGERNWYLPRRLDWLPRVGLEHPAVGARGLMSASSAKEAAGHD